MTERASGELLDQALCAVHSESYHVRNAALLAIRTLVENYAVKVDPALHAEVLARYKKLNLAPYKGFINPVYELVTDKDGNITDVTVSYNH